VIFLLAIRTGIGYNKWVAPAGVMELVDVVDSKASKSGSMKSDKNLDFSRLPSYNKL